MQVLHRQPRIVQNPNYQPTNEVDIVRKILHSPEPVQHQQIIERFVLPSNTQRQALLTEYRTKYGGAELVQELKDKLPPEELLSNDLFLTLFDTPAEHDAKCLYKAMKGLGTDEEMLIEVLVTRSNAELVEIKQAYHKLFMRDLGKDIAGDTSGTFRQLLLDLLEANRDESPTVDPIKAKVDAERLYKAGEGKWGTDEEVFIKMLANQSLAQLNLMFNEYEKLGKKHTIEKAVKAEFSGDALYALLAIVKFVRNGPVGEVAEMLHRCLEKGGKDELLVHLIVSHSEMDLGDIAAEYQQRFKIPLEQSIENSGKPSVLKNALIRMLKGNK